MQLTEAGHRLRLVACELAPDLMDIFNSTAGLQVWNEPLRTGKALEASSVACLLASVRAVTGTGEIPNLFHDNPHAFFARNEFPHHHGAQPGHTGTQVVGDTNLRYLGALTPKIVFKSGRAPYAVFREGVPIHYLKDFVLSGDTYLDRPDIAIVPGEFTSSVRNGIASADWRLGASSITSQIRAVNSPQPRVVDFTHTESEKLAPIAIIECSWRKRAETLRAQVARYCKVFEPIPPGNQLFVSGTPMKFSPIPTVVIDGDPSANLDAVIDSVAAWLSKLLI